MIIKKDNDLSTINIIRILCIKIGRFKNMYKLRFLRRYAIKIRIIKLFNEFFNRNIFDQSDALCGTLVSLFGEHQDLISEELGDLVKITPISIEMVIDEAKILYSPKEDRFDIDTLYEYASGIKFSYYKNSNLTRQLSEEWNKLLQPLENAYMKIIYCVADILNNPFIDKNMTIDEQRIDPFID